MVNVLHIVCISKDICGRNELKQKEMLFKGVALTHEYRLIFQQISGVTVDVESDVLSKSVYDCFLECLRARCIFIMCLSISHNGWSCKIWLGISVGETSSCWLLHNIFIKIVIENAKWSKRMYVWELFHELFSLKLELNIRSLEYKKIYL